MIDAYASQRHYLDHVRPVVDELGGRLFVSGSLERFAVGGRPGLPPRGDRGPVLVASYRDEVTVRQHSGRPIVLIEHGAGQHYGGTHAAHAGGPDRDDVVLFLCPNETVAERNRAVYPNARIAVVGCPRLDPWHLGRRLFVNHALPIVALAFHWDCLIVPEARTAFDHYAPALAGLATSFQGRLLGHGHPRIMGKLAPLYAKAGIEVVWTFDEVLDVADLLLFDVTSAGYEFASTDRPVVALNAPRYRREVHHGLRFWDTIPGLTIDGPGELPDAIEAALADPPELRELRDEANRRVYAARDGKAASRAAEAVLELGGG